MNRDALSTLEALYPGEWLGLNFAKGLYALAGVESDLQVETGDVVEPNGSTSSGPWQINRPSWPFLPTRPTEKTWAAQAAWIGPVVTSMAWGLQQLKVELEARKRFDPSEVWLWLPYYWRHGRSETLDTMRRLRSSSAADWSQGSSTDLDRLQRYIRYYSEAEGYQSPMPTGGFDFSKVAEAAGGWIALGFLFALLEGS